MCGIAGYWGQPGNDQLEIVVQQMINTIGHRGPDSHGVWLDPSSGFALAHSRLAIVDLSEHGHQPMRSPSGRFVVSYNGEIYNFKALRAELEQEGVEFSGDCDTEVLVAGLEHWGVDKTLTKSSGMFAFALWDRQTGTLTLARDRLGIKPLYYGTVGGSMLFASELRPILKAASPAPSVDPAAVLSLLRYGFIPAPSTILRGFAKLQPGEIVEFRGRERTSSRFFWNAVDTFKRSRRELIDASDDELTDLVHARLRESVRARTLSDVPLGAFLSGGIDSSVTVALLQEATNHPVKTFTIANDDARFDESQRAKAMAKRLGTDHTEVRIDPSHAIALASSVADLYDEPFADYSQIPTTLVSQVARRDVTVALTGDGGDEVFAGYNRHYWIPRWERMSRLVPRPARSGLAELLGQVSSEGWNRVGDGLRWLTPNRAPRGLGVKAGKLRRVLAAGEPRDVYRTLLAVNPGAHELMGTRAQFDGFPAHWDQNTLDSTLLADACRYLPDDILTKVDRASMSVSLEARVPLLDHKVVELGWQLPNRAKIRGRTTKWVLRRILARYAPVEMFEGPKTGFGAPVGHWLRHELSEWGHSLVKRAKARDDRLFNPDALHKLWVTHRSGGADLTGQLWPILVFQAWSDRYL